MKNKETTEPSRKRLRMSEDADDLAVTAGGKKARGRPRVDTQDATAADRRRTQIRLAQRAYRQRKETTISSLKQQSTQLHAIIDEMNRAFLRFNDSIVQSGVLRLKPELAKEFKQATETFASCVTSANERTLDSDEEEPRERASAHNSPGPTAPAAISQAQSSQIGTPSNQHQSWVFAARPQDVLLPNTDTSASQTEGYLGNISRSTYDLPEADNQVRRWQFTVGNTLDQSKSMSVPQQPQGTDANPQQQQQQQQHHILPFGLVDLPSREQSPFVPPYIFPVGVPAMGAELPPTPRSFSDKVLHTSITSLGSKPISPNYTYSYEEVTFARRLMRATFEAGFILLCNSDVHPAILNYIFKLSLPYLTLDQMRTRFKLILARGVTDDLDWYATPFLHLGGAGTHYQRRDAQGKPITLKNTWTIRQIGPSDKRKIRVESVADGQVQELEGIDLHGFEGEWFDAHDVQGYLEEQWSCRIDPRSSFAECLIEDDGATSSDNDTEPPSLSRGSTAGTSDDSPPPIPPSFNTFEPSYGLDMRFNNASMPDFHAAVPARPSLTDLSFDQTLGLDLAPGFGLGFDASSGYSTLNFDMMGSTEELPVIKQRPKKVAWVDVSKLIEKIMKRSVCLGRAPGYRRKDVDLAFREALIPAF